MPIEPIENKEKKKEKQQANKPLLNIQLPAPMSGDPNAPLSVGRHNATAQHNFQQVANILMTIINNQKIMGLAITQHDKAIKDLTTSIKDLAKNIRELLRDNNENDKSNSKTSNTK